MTIMIKLIIHIIITIILSIITIIGPRRGTPTPKSDLITLLNLNCGEQAQLCVFSHSAVTFNKSNLNLSSIITGGGV